MKTVLTMLCMLTLLAPAAVAGDAQDVEVPEALAPWLEPHTDLRICILPVSNLTLICVL